jgi:hypothetical protein
MERVVDRLQDCGDLVSAKSLQEEVLAAYAETRGTDSYSTDRQRSRLALIMFAMGDYDDARRIQERVLRDYQGQLNEDNEAIFIVQNNLRKVLEKQGDDVALAKVVADMVVFAEREYGSGDSRTVDFKGLPFGVHLRLGHAEAATELRRDYASSLKEEIGSGTRRLFKRVFRTSE